MDIQSIRRNQIQAAARRQGTEKLEKKGEAAPAQEAKAANSKGFSVSDTLHRLMDGLSRSTAQVMESRQLVRTGESALAEVRDALGRMAELANEAAEGEPADRGQLQAELEKLIDNIDRVLRGASLGGVELFRDGAAGDKTVLATLYLGAAVASGGAPSPDMDLLPILKGLQKLMDAIEDGASVDEAISSLTNGLFSSYADFQSQLDGDAAQNFMDHLVSLLLTGLTDDKLSALLQAGNTAALEALLAGMDGMSLDLLLLSLLPDAQGTAPSPAETPAPAETLQIQQQQVQQGRQVQQFGGFLVSGEGLSGVAYDPVAGVLTVDAQGDVTIQTANTAAGSPGPGEAPPAQPGAAAPQPAAAENAGPTARPAGTIIVSGQGSVTLKNAAASVLTADGDGVQIFSEGRNSVETLELRPGASLTLDGSGFLNLKALKGAPDSALRVKNGAVSVDGGRGQVDTTVYVDGPASFAARAAHVFSPGGKAMEPMDVVWKTLLPGWTNISSVEIDGKTAGMDLLNQKVNPDLARLWMQKENDPSHGHPIHTLFFSGKDEDDHPRTKHTFVQWSGARGAFQEVVMYPNPFTVTGGEEGTDWSYDQATQTLRILTGGVDAISGGDGVDALKNPFSGRLSFADNLGDAKLTLSGVSCKAAVGKALDLGRENNITLVLQNGTNNTFISGPGCAGVALGDGTSVTIDAAPRGLDDEDAPTGSLIAAGGNGGAGIGRCRGGSWDRISHIHIRGGTISAKGVGGGAGIGAGRHGFMGHVTITGGTVTAAGGPGGGAGIGGALGAPVGDITLRGGVISAEAAYHAAAIGAGIRGECGDITISGSTRIVKALGGNPGDDIGACLFGSCGRILISGGDTGAAGIKPWIQPGIPLQVDGATVTLPRFCLSSTALELNKLSLTTRENSLTSELAIKAAGRRVSRVEAAYNELCNRLEHNLDELREANMRFASPVRDTQEAGELLTDTKQSLLNSSDQAMRSHEQEPDDVLRLLRGR